MLLFAWVAKAVLQVAWVAKECYWLVAWVAKGVLMVAWVASTWGKVGCLVEHYTGNLTK